MVLALAGVMAPWVARADPDASAVAPEEPAAISATEAVQRAEQLLQRLESAEAAARTRAEAEEVASLIRAVQAQQADHPRLPYLTARLYALGGRGGDAVEHLQAFVATREGRTEWQAFRLLGDLLVTDYPRMAESNYRKAAALNPNEPSVLYGLSRCAAQFGATDEAIGYVREAIGESDARPLRYYSQLVTLLASAGKWDEAVREAERSVTIARRRAAEKRSELIPLLALDGQYQLLISTLQSQIAQPGRAGSEPELRLARVLRERVGVVDQVAIYQGLATIRAAMERAGDSASAVLRLEYGELLAAVGRTDEAIAVFEELLRMDPGHKAAGEWLRRLSSRPVEGTPPSP